jgi:DNA-binding transcriptional LysR family regulator
MTNNQAKKERSVSEMETMDLNQLRIFARVIEKSSFTEAARALRLPKSSVSKSVRALETTLGIQLIQRTSRSLRATDAGSRLYEAVRPAIAVIHESLATTATLGDTPRGRVRMSCPPDFDELVASYVARFCQRHPAVQVEVSLSARKVDLVAEGYDLALRGGELRDSALIARGSIPSEFGLFAAPGYLKQRKAPRRVADLHGHVCIGVHAMSGRASWKLASRRQDDRDQAEAVRVDCQVTTDDMRFAARLAVAGVGIALLPLMTASTYVGARSLVRVLPGFSVPNVNLRLITPGRDLEPMAVRLFREGLMSEPWAKGAVNASVTLGS